MKIATWKVRLMNITDKTQTIAGEMKKYGVDYKVLGIAEARGKIQDRRVDQVRLSFTQDNNVEGQSYY